LLMLDLLNWLLHYQRRHIALIKVEFIMLSKGCLGLHSL